MGKYHFIYFNVRGRGEPIRLLLKDNGIVFEETIVDHDSWSKWKSQMQFGQVPCLRDNDLQVVQSNAILRHLGRRHGLYGSNDEEATQIDILNDGIEDMRCKYYKMIYSNYENGKDAYIAELPKDLAAFEKLLAKNNADKTGFAVGSKRSFLDYNLTDFLDISQILDPKCLDELPVLSSYYKLNINRPSVIEHRQTSQHKGMTVNGNGKQ